MKKVGFIYDEIFLQHAMPAGHPESAERLLQIVEGLKEAGLWDKLIHVSPRQALEEEILAVHTRGYFDKIKNFTGYFDADTYVSERSFEAAKFAAGAVIEAIDRCKEGETNSAFCAVRPPGHHAEADGAMGFCIFNNVAVGARYAQKIGYRKVFIVDFDVHHGNGTQHIFEEDDSVFYFSTHQYPHYPGTGRDTDRGKGKGEGCTYNIAMHSGSGDKDYIFAYRDILPRLVKDFRPDIILVSAGYDIHVSDPLSSIHVTKEGMTQIVRGILLRSTATYMPSLPYVFVLEGGYDLHALRESVAITVAELLRE
jgi:acetoin utilization deacetylase AcuC-like enzyme